ncbi:MAG: substrate-binding domain-containing protein [Planctomycetaceae bacterium]
MKKSAAQPVRVLLINVEETRPEAAGVVAYGKSAGWITLLTRWYEDQNPREVVGWWDVQGVVGTLGSAGSSWRRCGIATVSLNYIDQDLALPLVLPDWESLGRQAAEHFIQRHFEHLAYCWLGDDWSLNAQRKGFSRAARAAGKCLHILDWTTNPHRGGGMRELRRWLGRELPALPKPLGLWVDSDWTAVEAIEACHEAGLMVPEQVAVLGAYNIEAPCEGAPVPLSSADPDMFAVGYEAARLLDRRMQGRPAPRKPVLVKPKGVVMRQSTNVQAVGDPQVAKALRFIWANYADPRIGVPQVVSATDTSKTALAAGFRHHLNCPIGEYLRNVRFAKARELLAQTTMTVQDIARQCGYGNAERLRDTLIRQTGSNPRAWRKKHRQKALIASDIPNHAGA